MLQIVFITGRVDSLPAGVFGSQANTRRWAKAFVLDEDIWETRHYTTDDDGVEVCSVFKNERYIK